MAESSTATTHILVALDASRHSRCTLEIAASLAAHRKMELTALFIEDVNLVHLAGLPFAMEVDRMSAVERQYDAPAMSRGLQTQQQLIRQLLTQITQGTALTASLRIARGHYVAEAMSASAKMDILFLGRERNTQPPEATREKWTTQRPHGVQPPPSRPVWVIFDGSAAAGRALTIATDLATSQHKQLLIVLQAATQEEAEALRGQSRTWLGEPHPPARYMTSPLTDTAALLRTVRQKGCSLMVINREHVAHLDQTVKAYLEGLDCPVVLVA